MKILIQFASGASYWIRNSWRRVFESCGHQVFMWNKEQLPINDVIVQTGPIDIFLGNTYDVDRSVDKFIRSNPQMKVALFGSNWGNLTDPIDNKKYPIVKVTEEEKRILGKLYQDIQKPDLIHIHVTDKYLEPCMGGWTSLGIPICGILNGADTFVYKKSKIVEKYICDVGYVGSRWNYKARTLDKYLGKLCDDEWQKINIKIFGQGGWNKPQYLGSIDDGQDSYVFASAKICPNISEQHSVDFGYDIIERCFKVPASGGFLISDNVVALSDIYTNNECPIFHDYEEFISLINYYMKNESNKLELQKKQEKIILESHTYFHRMSKLLNQLKLITDSNKCLATYKSIIKFAN